MIRWMLDTDHVTLFEHGHREIWAKVSAAPALVSVCVVTVEESVRGRLAVLSRNRPGPARVMAYRQFLETVQLFNLMRVLPFDDACEAEFARLRGLRLGVGTQDRKIAAVALVRGLCVVTRNTSDFGRIPGLTVEDWTL